MAVATKSFQLEAVNKILEDSRCSSLLRQLAENWETGVQSPVWAKYLTPWFTLIIIIIIWNDYLSHDWLLCQFLISIFSNSIIHLIWQKKSKWPLRQIMELERSVLNTGYLLFKILLDEFKLNHFLIVVSYFKRNQKYTYLNCLFKIISTS